MCLLIRFPIFDCYVREAPPVLRTSSVIFAVCILVAACFVVLAFPIIAFRCHVARGASFEAMSFTRY